MRGNRAMRQLQNRKCFFVEQNVVKYGCVVVNRCCFNLLFIMSHCANYCLHTY